MTEETTPKYKLNTDKDNPCFIEDGMNEQERIGRGGRPFYIYKFRSMVVDAEKEGEELLQQDNAPG